MLERVAGFSALLVCHFTRLDSGGAAR
jgi:hypothetical protein